MSTTLTIRTDETLREALERRAEVQGKTLSALVREMQRDAEPEAGQRALYRTAVELTRRSYRLVVAVHDPLENESLFASADVSPP